jgi:hypothetical protein
MSVSFLPAIHFHGETRGSTYFDEDRMTRPRKLVSEIVFQLSIGGVRLTQNLGFVVTRSERPPYSVAG